MNNQAQIIAIAEACGWKVSRVPTNDEQDSHSLLVAPDGRVKMWDGNSKDLSGFVHALPDYLNDLNAMHEAEKVLHGNKWRPYHDKLAIINCHWDSGRYPAIDATAAQRAQAFLQTLGLWIITS